jgi:threonine aldolase
MKTIDLRSDTVTLPTQEMRHAMSIVEVGDDVYQDDPTIIELERYAAELVGKEAALFVPSGTMGNQLCLMTHTKRGDEIVTGANNHIVIHEVGSVAVLSQANLRTISHPDDFILPNDFLKAIRSNDIHEPHTTVLSMENALSNGKVMPLNLMKENYDIAQARNIKVHLDGARLFNAATYLKCDPKELTQYCDSVMFCLSKGLCAPIGSMIAGSREFIERARKNRKLLGGGMRQAGILAAAGLLALKDMIKRLDIDHQNALYLGQELIKTGLFTVKIEDIHINMVFFNVVNPNFDFNAFEAYLAKHNVKINPNYNGYRFVTHYWITREDIDTLIILIKNYVKN